MFPVQRLVYLDGELTHEGEDYVWINDRLLMKRQLWPGARITVLKLPVMREEYGGASRRRIEEILDPGSKE